MKKRRRPRLYRHRRLRVPHRCHRQRHPHLRRLLHPPYLLPPPTPPSPRFSLSLSLTHTEALAPKSLSRLILLFAPWWRRLCADGASITDHQPPSAVGSTLRSELLSPPSLSLSVSGKLPDGTVFVNKGHGDNEDDLFEFKTDEEQVIDGLDRAVTTMKKGEVALLTVAPEYGFGSTEAKQELATVPPNSTLHYEIELVSFEKEKESWDMNTAEKIEAAGKKKEEGNALFKAGKYARASKRYEKAAKFIEYDTSFTEDEKKQSKALKVSCMLNNAACKLKLKDYKEAEKLCTKGFYFSWIIRLELKMIFFLLKEFEERLYCNIVEHKPTLKEFEKRFDFSFSL